MKVVRNAALSILAPLAVLFIIEAAAGMVFSDMKAFYRLHPKYLYVTKTDFKRTVVNKRSGEQILFRTAALGYRGSFSTDKTRPRVLVYGDSNVQALFDKEGDTFPSRLETQLKQSGRDFEVINAGTSGYGPDQNLLRMEDEISVLKPDFIIFQIFTDNDFGDLIRNKIYEIKDNSLVRRNPHISPRIRFEYLCANSYICRTLKKTAMKINSRNQNIQIDLVKLCKEEFESYKKNNTIDFSMWEDHLDADLKVSPQAASSQYKINLMRLLVKELKRVSGLYPGVKMLLLIEPAKSDVPDAGKDKPFTVEVLERAASDAGVDYVNLYTRFAEAGMQNMYNGYDDHWSSRGQALAAILTADKMISVEK